MEESAGQVFLDVVLNSKSIMSQANTAPFKSAASKIGRMFGAAISTAAVISFTKSCLELGSNLSEVQNVVNKAFPSMNAQVDAFAKNAKEQFGLSETVAKQYMGTLGAMSSGMGFAESQAYDMAKAVTGLTGDVASFYNMSSDEAFNKLKAIWTGETEGLKSLGVVMTQTALEQYALNEGLGKTTAKMTEQEKTMLRYRYVMSQLGVASGDFADTSASWANQVRLLTLNFQSLKATLGQGFIAVFTPIIQGLNSILTGMNSVAQAFNEFLGIDTSSLSNASDTSSDISSNFSEVEQSVENVNRMLAGFDSITKLSDSASNSTASLLASNITAVGKATVTTEQQASALAQKMEAIFGPLKGDIGKLFSDIKVGDWFSAGNDVSHIAADILNLFAEAINQVDWQQVGTNIGEFLEGIDWEAVWKATGNILQVIFDAAISAWKGSFDASPLATTIATGLALTTWGKGTIGRLLGTAGSGIGTAIGSKAAIGIATAIAGYEFGNYLYENNGTVQTIADAITKPVADAIVELESKDMRIHDSNGKAINAGSKPINTKPSSDNTTKGINSIVKLSEKLNKLNKDTLPGIEKTTGSIFFTARNNTSKLDTELARLKGTADTATKSLGDGITGLTNTSSNVISGIRKLWADKLGTLTSSLKIGVDENEVNAKSSAIHSQIQDKLNSLGVKNLNVDTASVDSTGYSIVNRLGNIFSKLKLELTSFGNTNQSNSKLSDLLTRTGSAIGSIALRNISWLAQGGYVKPNTPQLAVIGDNRHQGEVVAPEDKLLEMAMKAAELSNKSSASEEVVSVLIQILVVLKNLNLDFSIDGKSLKDIVVSEINKHTADTGVCEIVT